MEFVRKYQPVNYNPIRPFVYQDSGRSFLKHASCTTNALGVEYDTPAMFCYDAHYDGGTRVCSQDLKIFWK